MIKQSSCSGFSFFFHFHLICHLTRPSTHQHCGMVLLHRHCLCGGLLHPCTKEQTRIPRSVVILLHSVHHGTIMDILFGIHDWIRESLVFQSWNPESVGWCLVYHSGSSSPPFLSFVCLSLFCSSMGNIYQKGITYVYFTLASGLWWLSISINLIATVVFRYSPQSSIIFRLGRLEFSHAYLIVGITHLFCWGIPLVVVIIVLSAHRLGYGGSDFW